MFNVTSDTSMLNIFLMSSNLNTTYRNITYTLDSSSTSSNSGGIAKTISLNRLSGVLSIDANSTKTGSYQIHIRAQETFKRVYIYII